MKRYLLDKILVLILIVIIILNIISPIVQATSNNVEIISVSGKLTHYESSLENNVSVLGFFARAMVESIVKILTFIPDSIMVLTTTFMKQTSIEAVMAKTPQNTDKQATASISLDISEYNVNQLLYPKFNYSPEEIFSGEIDLLDIDFISGDNENVGWHKVRNAVSSWYRVLRIISVAGLLSVLIYTGIKIMLSSNAKDKSKYKKMLMNWLIAMILVFVMQYIMAFILIAIKEFTQLFSKTMGGIEVNIGGKTFVTNLIGLARFQIQKEGFFSKLGYLAVYIGLIFFTIKFTFIYLKRVCYMALLTVLAPLVALTYPIDKEGDGKAQGLQMWLSEFLFNALLQPLHYLLYYILIESALTLAAENLIYALVALWFMTHAEKLLKQIFQFGKAGAGTVSGLSEAFVAGTLASSITNSLNKFLPGGNKKTKGGNSTDGYNFFDTSDMDYFVHDTGIENFMGINGSIGDIEGNEEDEENSISDSESIVNGGGSATNENSGIQINNSIEQYRRGLAGIIPENARLTFADGDPRSIDDLFKIIYENQIKLNDPNLSDAERKRLIDEIDFAQSLIQSRIQSGEYEFATNGIPQQYIDGDSRSNFLLMKDIINSNYNAKSDKYNNARGIQLKYQKQAAEDLKLLKRRIAENNYINSHGGAKALFSLQNRNSVGANNLVNINNGTMSNNALNSNSSARTNITVNANNINNNVANGQADNNVNVVEERRHSDMFDAFNYVKNLLSRKHYGDRGLTQRGGRPTLGMGNYGEREYNGVENNYRGALQMLPHQVYSAEVRAQYEQAPIRELANKVSNTPVGRGLRSAGKTLIKPVIDTEKTPSENVERLFRNVTKVGAEFAVGSLVAAVQMGISITDGKYNPSEGIAAFAAGAAAVNAIDKKISEGKNEKIPQSFNEYKKVWKDKDSVIDAYNPYNSKYQGDVQKAKAAKQRAMDNYLIRGISDPKEQQQAMKFADWALKSGAASNMEDADRLAIAVLEYKRDLLRTSNYGILYSNKNKEAYLEAITEDLSGTQKDIAIRQHREFIGYVAKYDAMNK